VVEVTGNETVPTAVILSQLQRVGVRPGAYGPAIPEREAANTALLGLPELSYMAINIYGTRAEVVVREAEQAPKLLDEETPADVVAMADGIIEDIQADAGQAMFQDGDAVVRGDTLISGTLDLREPEYGTVDLGYLVVRARGSVTARTWRILEETVPLTAAVKEYTGKEQTGYSLKILWFDLDFFQNSSISGGRYDKITETAELALLGRPMPAALTTVTRREYILREEPVDQEAEAARLEQVLLTRLEGLMEARQGEVLHTDLAVRTDGERLTVTLLAECREEIGRTVEREGTVGRIPGTPGTGNG
ncbi:MAG: sporulation protein YqfD, partial [Oscillospiraceae bacterium]